MPIIHKARYIYSKDRFFSNAAFSLESGVITEIIKNPQNIDNVIDHGNSLITPGFINIHAHLQYTDLKKTPEKIGFIDWITNLVQQYLFWSEEKKINSFKRGLKEAVLSGTTCIANLAKEDFSGIFNKFNIQAFLFQEVFASSEKFAEGEFNKLVAEYERLTGNKPDNVEIGISPHSIYNVHPVLWKKIAEFAKDNNILVHTHLAEAASETDWLNDKTSDIEKLHQLAGWEPLKPYQKGLSPVEFLENLGVLDDIGKNLIAAHLIQLNNEQVEKLVEYGVKIAHCPRSNIYLHGKTLKLDKLKPGVIENTGVGTDSKYSNYDLSLLNEAKFIKDRTNLDLNTILNMLTINAARVLKIDKRKGSLEPNKDGDFLVFKLNRGETPESIINKGVPDEIYIKGELIAKNSQFVSENWKELD